VRASVDSGSRAIVLEGTGRGNANDQVVEGVREAAAAGVHVVVCSRCVAGRVEPVYGRGGGRDLAEAGAILAGDLAGPKVRVLLQLALGAGVEPAAVLAGHAP
jgi:L-asparaginase